jgi:hypothetical protein
MVNYTQGEDIMAQKNDERILVLKKQIEDEKKELGKQPRFCPVTTCMFNYEGNRVNIHTLTSVKDINTMLVYFNIYAMSAENLGIDCTEVCLDGFSVSDWMEDLNAKKTVVEYNEKKSQLNALEKKLDKLLSDDKKTELEIDAIADLTG